MSRGPRRHPGRGGRWSLDTLRPRSDAGRGAGERGLYPEQRRFERSGSGVLGAARPRGGCLSMGRTSSTGRRGTARYRRGEGSAWRLGGDVDEPSVVPAEGDFAGDRTWRTGPCAGRSWLRSPEAAGPDRWRRTCSLRFAAVPSWETRWESYVSPAGSSGPKEEPPGFSGWKRWKARNRVRVLPRRSLRGKGFRAPWAEMIVPVRSNPGQLPFPQPPPTAAAQPPVVVVTPLAVHQTGCRPCPCRSAPGRPGAEPRGRTAASAGGGAGRPVPHRSAGRTGRRPGPACGRLRRRAGGQRPGLAALDQPGVEERSTSTMRAVRPSNSPALRTRPVQRRTSPHARARCASCKAFQRQPS